MTTTLPAAPTTPLPRPRRGLAVRTPAFWAALAACLFGLASLVVNYRDVARQSPAATVLALALLVPTLMFGYALARRVRPVRSPARPASLACVVWGATAASGCAIIANTGLNAVWARTHGIAFADAWGATGQRAQGGEPQGGLLRARAGRRSQAGRGVAKGAQTPAQDGGSGADRERVLVHLAGDPAADVRQLG